MWVRGVQSLLSWKGGARSLSGYFRRGFNPCYLGRATASGTRLGRRRAIAYFNPCSGGCFSAIQFFVAICHKDAPRGETERGLALARWRLLRSPRFLRPPSSRPVRITRAREVLSSPEPITLVMVCDTLRTRRKYSSRDLHGALWGIDSAVRGWRLAAEKKPAEPRIAVQRAGQASSAPGPLWGAKGDPRFAGVVGREPGGQPCYASYLPAPNPHLV